MKVMKKALSLLLAVSLMVSLFTISASARTTTKYQGKSLVILGDSIAAGFGLMPGSNDMFTQIFRMPHGEFVEKSWAKQIRDQFGFSQVTSVNLSRNMWRTDEYLRVLDPAFEDNLCEPENAMDQYISDYLMFFSELTKPGDTIKLSRDIQQAIRQADVLVFSLGSNDILTYAICKPLMLPFYQVFGRQAAVALATVTQMELKTLDSAEDLAKFAFGTLNSPDLESCVWEGVASFKQNYNRLLGIIYALNPDVKIYAMGITQPFKDMMFAPGIPAQLFPRLNVEVIADVRNYITQKNRYRNRVTYIDCSDVGGYYFPDVINPMFFLRFIVAVHPDEAGHRRIAQHVAAALEAG